MNNCFEKCEKKKWFKYDANDMIIICFFFGWNETRKIIKFLNAFEFVYWISFAYFKIVYRKHYEKRSMLFILTHRVNRLPEDMGLKKVNIIILF